MTSRTKRTNREPATVAEFLTPGRIILLVAALLTLIFIFENTRRTEIRLLVPEVTMPLWLALFFPAAIGFLCGFFLRRRNR